MTLATNMTADIIDAAAAIIADRPRATGSNADAESAGCDVDTIRAAIAAVREHGSAPAACAALGIETDAPAPIGTADVPTPVTASADVYNRRTMRSLPADDRRACIAIIESYLGNAEWTGDRGTNDGAVANRDVVHALRNDDDTPESFHAETAAVQNRRVRDMLNTMVDVDGTAVHVRIDGRRYVAWADTWTGPNDSGTFYGRNVGWGGMDADTYHAAARERAKSVRAIRDADADTDDTNADD